MNVVYNKQLALVELDLSEGHPQSHTDLQLRLTGPTEASRLKHKTRKVLCSNNGNMDFLTYRRTSVRTRLALDHVFCGLFGRQVWRV